MNLKSKFYRDTKVFIEKIPYNKTMDDRKIKAAIQKISRCPVCGSIKISYFYTYIKKNNTHFIDRIRNLDNHIVTCTCKNCNAEYEICIKLNHEYGMIDILKIDDYMNQIKNEIMSKGVIDAF